MGARGNKDFFGDLFSAGFLGLKRRMDSAYPQVFIILGNDDARSRSGGYRNVKTWDSGIICTTGARPGTDIPFTATHSFPPRRSC